MGYFLKVVKAEAVKQHKNYFYNKTIYISLFLWPMLVFISTYYGYKPFDIMGISQYVPYLKTDNIILFVIFSAAIIFVKGKYFSINLAAATVGIILVVVLSLIWGMFLNSLFLYSRDTGFLFTILEEPMELFGGVKVPTAIFPLWAKAISYIFPLTYTADILRRALLNSESIYQLRSYIFISIVSGILMLLLTSVFLKYGEKHAKKTGNMSLF